tara:strand:- start:219 stop:572 length:354 start_codon:yes stop_codon:yes gene_type:complete
MKNVHKKRGTIMNNEMKNDLYRDHMILINRLNDLEYKYQHYITNLDNIYAWACDQYNTEKPTAKQLESICEYPQNYSDYDKITDQLVSKMKKIIKQLPELEYDGYCYRIKTNKRRGK